jgi:N-acetyltransferase 10
LYLKRDTTTKKEEKAISESLLNEQLVPRTDLPPLLQCLNERPAEHLDYLGVSYGLNDSLYKFWKRAGYAPLYLSQSKNDITGEHSCIMLKSLGNENITKCNPNWMSFFQLDFRNRFTSLLGYSFREFHPSLAVSILHTNVVAINDEKNLSAKGKPIDSVIYLLSRSFIFVYNIFRNGSTRTIIIP